MTLDERTTRILRDLVTFAAMAERLVARGKEEYDEDETLRLAAEAILHKIGEAVSRLPDEFLADHPEVPWRAMKATRNIVAHKYEQVDYEILWRGLAVRLPTEMESIRAVIAAEEPAQSTGEETSAG
ncbi:DUF86 domain-containing protein [Nocardioides speluncae]|uniref:HepT-like ribonuclease domain-containing protein n=1 Tax=Nocardioides speluncae TaxID=2670337 RepID=UPI000D68C51C|nr:HepT-like ribonuclease domain-containing protein [Nocardioides speluncae]